MDNYYQSVSSFDDLFNLQRSNISIVSKLSGSLNNKTSKLKLDK